MRLITDEVGGHINEIVMRVFEMVEFVSGNQAKAKSEMARDDRTTFILIEDRERRVKEAQDRFIEEVRRVSFAFGPKAT